MVAQNQIPTMTQAPQIPDFGRGTSSRNVFLFRNQVQQREGRVPFESIERAMIAACVPGVPGPIALLGGSTAEEVVLAMLVRRDLWEVDREIQVERDGEWNQDWFAAALRSAELENTNVNFAIDTASPFACIIACNAQGVSHLLAEGGAAATNFAESSFVHDFDGAEYWRKSFTKPSEHEEALRAIATRDFAVQTSNQDQIKFTGATLKERTAFAEVWQRLDAEPQRFDFLNHCIQKRGFVDYLEIGVNNPATCFDLIETERKWSVDPGLEYAPNPVDFPMTSDAFFKSIADLRCERLPLPQDRKFDLIFIDGLHQAEQAWRDIENSLKHLRPGGIVMVHDCLPPNEHCATNTYPKSLHAVTSGYWPGSTWRAFERYCRTGEHRAFLIDGDSGMGVIDTAHRAGEPPVPNPFLVLENYRPALAAAGLVMTFEEGCQAIEKAQ